MIQKYRELTEEEEAFYETPEGKAVLEAQEEEDKKAWEEEIAIPDQFQYVKAEEEKIKDTLKAYREGKYKRKKYIDEDGVWIPRIVKLLILILLFWLVGNVDMFDMMKYR